MSILSDIEIRQAITDGEIFVHPYLPENVRSASIDVTIGYYYYVAEHRLSSLDTYNPYDRSRVDQYFGEPQRAMPHGQWCELHERKLFDGIPEDHPIIVLEPGQRILAHTHEFIGAFRGSVPMMQARSTTGRNGIVVCYDAGWGDVGYVNRWAMEVMNINRHVSVPIPVGERVAQIVFNRVGDSDQIYGSGGKYQTGEDSVVLIGLWKPEWLLPRAYLDERELPIMTTNPYDTRSS